MAAQEILIRFLGAALGEKRDRICGFVAKPRNRNKFFDLLYHSLGQSFRPSVVVAELPEEAWSSPALAFIAPDRFGVEVPSMRQALDSFGEGGGALLVSEDSRFGIWCDHTRFDDRVCVALSSDAVAVAASRAR